MRFIFSLIFTHNKVHPNVQFILFYFFLEVFIFANLQIPFLDFGLMVDHWSVHLSWKNR